MPLMGRSVPTSPKPRTRPAVERRAALLDAAEQLFVLHGMAATTVEQITTAAGVAKGSFYLHFASKEDVLDGLRQRFVETILTAIDSAVAQQPTDDWGARLGVWATACATGYAVSARLHQMLFSDVPPPTRDGLADNPLIDDLTRLLHDGGAAGAWHVADPRFTAVFLFNALHGVILDAGDRIDEEAFAQAVRAHCRLLVGLPTE